MKKNYCLLALICLLSLGHQVAAQEMEAPTATVLKLADPLTDNMVVQQNKPFRVWGTAPAGEEVKITADWLSSPVVVVAGSQGTFTGILEVPAAKKGDFTAHTLRIASADMALSLQHILIGEVWICSGQSNMQFGMKEVLNSATEIAAAQYPHIRIFNSGLNFSAQPIMDIQGKWQALTPATVKDFSAVGYYFGRELFQQLNIPIGLVFTGIGASAAQAYVPRDVLAADPVLNATYLQPYLNSERAKEKINGGFSFEKVTRPFLLYNAMIHPFTNLSVRGICWYQGESNRQERSSYTHLMYALVNSWRQNFGQGNLPFYYVQVAPYYYEKEDSSLADYAFFREAQEKISALNNTAMVVTMDVGEARDLHPKNKKPIGIRLAKTALNRTYGFLDLAYQGPQYHSVIFEGRSAIIRFTAESVASGLDTNDGKAPAYFFVAGADKVFHPGKAEIIGDRILVRSKKVRKPVAVRYAFTNYPVTNLMNRAGFPAVPFRTDGWAE